MPLASGVWASLVAVGLVLVTVYLARPVVVLQGFSTIWPGALAVGFLSVLPRQRWPFPLLLTFAGVFVLRHAGAPTLAIAILRSSVDAASIIIAAMFLRNFREFPLSIGPNLWRLISLALSLGLLRAAVFLLTDAFMGSGLRQEAGLAVGLGTVLGLMTLVPVVWAVVRTSSTTSWPAEIASGASSIASIALLAVVVFFVLPSSLPAAVGFAPFPLLLIVAAWQSQTITALSTTSFLFVVAEATTFGHGPFAHGLKVEGSPTLTGVYLQASLVSLVLGVWLLASSREGQRQTQTSLDASAREHSNLRQTVAVRDDQFRAAVIEATIPMSFGPVDGSLGTCNRAMLQFLEIDEATSRHHRWSDFLAEATASEINDFLIRRVPGSAWRFSRDLEFALDSGTKWGRVSAVSLSLIGSDEPWTIVQIVDITEAVAAHQELQRRADTDVATGVLSRSRIVSDLDVLLAERGSVGVMMLDLSAFRSVISSLDLSSADDFMREIAHDIAGIMPAEQTIGRLDELRFLILVPTWRSNLDLASRAQDVLRAVARVRLVQGRRVSRTGSIGIAVSVEGDRSDSVIRHAENAASTAASSGRSRVHVVGSGREVNIGSDALQVEHELRDAIDLGEFVPYFQSQIDLETGQVVGYEALARWQHRSGVVRGPSEFLDVLESSGLIVDFGLAMLRSVCAILAAHPDVEAPVSVNATAAEVGDGTWLTSVLGTLERFRIPPRRLAIELTESTILDLTDDARRSLNALRAIGVAIHVDDFGTGYTSIATLQQLPITAVKLDRTFVEPLGQENSAAYELVHAVAALANALGIETISEGVETESQAKALREAGWRVGQGHLFSEALQRPW